jgi:hypothetical protein
MQRVNTSSFN